MSEPSRSLCRPGLSAFAIALGPFLESIIVTIQGEGILQCSSANQDVSATWSVGQSKLVFTCGVVFNTASQLYYAAVLLPQSDCHQVLSWSPNAAAGTIDRVASRVTLPKIVDSIYPTVCEPRASSDTSDEQPEASTSGRDEHGGVFVVFSDGTIALDSFYSNGKQGQCLGPKGSKVEATSCHQGIVAVLSVDEVMKTRHLIVYGLTGTTLVRLAAQQIQLPSTACPTSLSLVGSRLSLLCADGSLQSYGLVTGTETELSLRLQVTRRLAGHEPGVQIQAKTPRPKNGKRNADRASVKRKSEALNAVPLQPKSIVITAPNGLVATASWKDDEGAGRKRLRLDILDGTYGTVRRSTEILSADLTTYSKATSLQGIHLGSNSEQLVVLASGSLILVPLSVPSPTLASLIGALSEGSGQAQIAAKEVLHPDEWPKLRPLPLSQAKPNWLPGQDMAERLAPGALLEVAVPCEIREDASGGASTSEVDLDAETVRERIHCQSSYSSQEEAIQLAKFLLHSPTERRSRVKALPCEYYAELCLNLAKKGYWEAYGLLTAERPVTSLSHAPGLLIMLAKAGHHKHLARILPKARDIPAEDFLQALQHLLSRQSSDSAEAWLKVLRDVAPAEKPSQQEPASLVECSDAAILVDSFSAQEVTLHSFVTSRIDANTLLLILKRLGSQDLTLLFQYLLSWLRHMSEPLVTTKGRELLGGLWIPSLKQILQWCGAVIDASLVGLSSKPETRQIALGMQHAVAKHLQGLAGMERLCGMVQHIQNAEPLPGLIAGSELYVVELLDLSIRQ